MLSIYERVRDFLARRHKVAGRGYDAPREAGWPTHISPAVCFRVEPFRFAVVQHGISKLQGMMIGVNFRLDRGKCTRKTGGWKPETVRAAASRLWGAARIIETPG